MFAKNKFAKRYKNIQTWRYFISNDLYFENQSFKNNCNKIHLI